MTLSTQLSQAAPRTRTADRDGSCTQPAAPGGYAPRLSLRAGRLHLDHPRRARTAPRWIGELAYTR